MSASKIYWDSAYYYFVFFFHCPRCKRSPDRPYLECTYGLQIICDAPLYSITALSKSMNILVSNQPQTGLGNMIL